ncbi:MAG: translation initiation factor IF-2 subunit gamma [Candidatus Aenigmatarchaeota archaeon]|nr:MAG: translation initiation factor IF-2 subunit gamma [Candidatus Aenigmarchaeota archaeon]
MSEKKEINPKLIPEVNIGLVGHVDHGKTSLTEALTGKWTDTHSEEIKRGITIRLGYADATFYECPECKGCKRFGTNPKCIKCFSDCKPVRTVSFVDAPGHETLMATVLSGTSLIDGALLVIAANEHCPQPQTKEHLTALNIIGIKNIVIVQNKIDLVSREEALKNYKQIKEFVKGTTAENAPIVPVSAHLRINIDALIEAIEKEIPTPKRDPEKPPKMLIARSFDVNKPGTEIKKLKGGVVGGSLVQGELKLGDTIEIRPGVRIGEEFKPIKTKITGLQKAMKDLEKAGPGGLLGVSTELDPSLAKSDALVGNVAGLPESLPPVFSEIEIKTHLFERVVGMKEENRVEPIKTNDVLMLTCGTARTVGVVVSGTQEKIKVKLKIPVCADKTDKIAISRQVLGRWRLIGWGNIL